MSLTGGRSICPIPSLCVMITSNDPALWPPLRACVRKHAGGLERAGRLWVGGLFAPHGAEALVPQACLSGLHL